MKSFFSVYIFFVVFMIEGCSTPIYDIEKSAMSGSYPTSIIVNLPLKNVRYGVLESLKYEYQIDHPVALEQYGYRGALFSFEVSNDENVVCREVFSTQENQDDICINMFQDYWYSKSYVVNGKAPLATGRIHVHFSSVSNTSTKISIGILGHKVVNGLECCGPHGRYSRLTEVRSTGAEEYAFVKHFADYFNVEVESELKSGLREL